MRQLRSTLKFVLGGLVLSGVVMLAGCREGSYIAYSEDEYPGYYYDYGYDYGPFFHGDFDDFHHRDFDRGHRDHDMDRRRDYNGAASVRSNSVRGFTSGGGMSSGHHHR